MVERILLSIGPLVGLLGDDGRADEEALLARVVEEDRRAIILWVCFFLHIEENYSVWAVKKQLSAEKSRLVKRRPVKNKNQSKGQGLTPERLRRLSQYGIKVFSPLRTTVSWVIRSQ